MAKTAPDALKKAKGTLKSRSQPQTDLSLNKEESSHSKVAAPQGPDAEPSDQEGSVQFESSHGSKPRPSYRSSGVPRFIIIRS